jgi:transcriptional regulator with XRE-family HTH domain
MIGSRHVKTPLRFPIMAQLREERRKRGLQLVDLAQEVGYHRVTIGRWERGIDYPSIAALDDMCQFLGLELVVSLRHVKAGSSQ